MMNSITAQIESDIRRPLGKTQIKYLRDFRTQTRYHPSTTGEPWPVMKALIKRGLLYSHQRAVKYWNPVSGKWCWHRDEWVAEITIPGMKALALQQRRKIL